MPFPLTAEQIELLEKHIGDKGKALKTHETYLAKEISKGSKQTAFHTISRHGPQTGWVAQLVRLMTGETPDQPFALNGVRASILQWEKTSGEQGALPDRTRNIRYAAADSVGAFLGPEMEVEAIKFASLRTKELQSGMFAEMETGPSTRRVKKWEKYKYIEIIASTKYKYCGVSFVLKTDKKRPERKVFEEALTDYLERGLTLKKQGTSLYDEMMFRQVKASGSEIPKAMQSKLAVRFPNLGDLLEFLNVDAVMMKNIRLVLKRVPETGFFWKLHTAYAVNQPPQIRPDAPGSWTGLIKSTEHGDARRLNMHV